MPLAHKANNPLPYNLLLSFLSLQSVARVLGFERRIDDINMMMAMLAVPSCKILILSLLRNNKVVDIGVGSIDVRVNLQCKVINLLRGFGLVQPDLHL